MLSKLALKNQLYNTPFSKNIRYISQLTAIERFKNTFPEQIKHIKDKHISEDFSALIKPYNAPISKYNQPAIYIHANSTKLIKNIIELANQTQSCIIPMGANTNLVKLTSFEPVVTSKIPLAIYLSYPTKNINYCNKTGQLTCTPATTMADIHTKLISLGRRWDVDFSAQNATLGGIISTNAGGQHKKANQSVTSYKLMGSDLNQHTVYSSEDTSSMIPIGNQEYLSASQGTCGMITEITIQTEKQWQASYSAFITVPLEIIHSLNKTIFHESEQSLVSCELIDHNCFKSNPQSQLTPPNKEAVIMLCQFATEDNSFEHDSMWENICLKYPSIAESIIISSSKKQENEFWTYRHHISDNNRTWAKKNNLTYIGYDIDLPKDKISLLIPKIRSELKRVNAELFCFGHGMQSFSNYTLHINIAFPNKSKLKQNDISTILIKTLEGSKSTFAAEHGGIGHKSIHDTLNIATPDTIRKSLTLMRQFDPYDTFRTDIKEKIIDTLN